MSKEVEISCARPSTKVEKEVVEKTSTLEIIKEEGQKMIKVGKPAPLFTAPAYHNGKFTEVNLEDYKGKWVLLCFYPGDFTFV